MLVEIVERIPLRLVPGGGASQTRLGRKSGDVLSQEGFRLEGRRVLQRNPPLEPSLPPVGRRSRAGGQGLARQRAITPSNRSEVAGARIGGRDTRVPEQPTVMLAVGSAGGANDQAWQLEQGVRTVDLPGGSQAPVTPIALQGAELDGSLPAGEARPPPR